MGPRNSLPLCPPVAAWFARSFRGPTPVQEAGWEALREGEDTLIAAPTGSGKTLAAFLLVLDRLARRTLEGSLGSSVQAVYVSPLRALSHDIHRNLEVPLQGIAEEAKASWSGEFAIRASVRTGDTPPAARAAMVRHPPHLLVTTPESLFLLITSRQAREMLRSVRTVIVDEIHALFRDRRGAHLCLTLERLEALTEQRPQRIGLSATQRPMEVLGRWLSGGPRRAGENPPACRLVDLGHQRDLDLAVVVPPDDELRAVASQEQWARMLDSLAGLVRDHGTTLIFVNTRRLSERLAHLLAERLGPAEVAAHHGSLSKDRRLQVEDLLRSRQLKALVATASLELGIDVGHVDLVCQIGSPRSITTLLQRVGRSGHSLGLRPKGRLFPTTRDELVECAALLRAVRRGLLDRTRPPVAPLDILAQQVVAACADASWAEDELFALVRRAAPFSQLPREDFDQVLTMLSEGFETPRGRRGVRLHRDRLHGRVRGRRGARLAAMTSGGAIPDRGEYRVVLDPGDVLVGMVEEDWAVESAVGEIFVLGSQSWRIRRIEAGVVRVVDAQGAPPSIPFWLGEAPGRTPELSAEVSELRSEVAARLPGGLEAACAWLEQEAGIAPGGALQIAVYLQAQVEAAGLVPTRSDLLVERFFDQAGGLQLVIHLPFGARINRGLGLLLRKRFCRAFNMELQAAATDDAVVISLGNPQTFPLEIIPRFLASRALEEALEQAFLPSPFFRTRWRWNATRSLALLRHRAGRTVPFNLQRMEADDLLASVFPEQAACQENLAGPLSIPDHPLIRQTLKDCLHEAADVDGVRDLLAGIETGKITLHFREMVAPSPFAHEILGARPYAFLDDAPLEERRTRAVALRHVLPVDAGDLGRLDPEAIARVRGEAAPQAGDADEQHEILVDAVINRDEGSPEVEELLADGRAGRIVSEGGGPSLIFARERVSEVQALYPGRGMELRVVPGPPAGSGPVTREAALDAVMRGHLALSGPVSITQLAKRLGLPPEELEGAAQRLQARGIALVGRFEGDGGEEQVCDRSLLARIHRYTLARLRQEIQPVSVSTFLRFLTRWQHLHPETRAAGEGGLLQVLEKLAGWTAPAWVWEAHLLPLRVGGYLPALLDALCLGGRVAWGCLARGSETSTARPTRAMLITFFPREAGRHLLRPRQALLDACRGKLRGPAETILAPLRERGALFASEIRRATGLLPAEMEDGLRELVALGLVSCDGFAPLRRLLRLRRVDALGRRRAQVAGPPLEVAGRWHLLSREEEEEPPEAAADAQASRLLLRYGVVFRELLRRESLLVGWRPVLHGLRRLEARGLVRGGRFVTGFSGEQFALPEAVPLLRRERHRAPEGLVLEIPAADPLNLAGILTPGARLATSGRTKLRLEDGVPLDPDGCAANSLGRSM